MRKEGETCLVELKVQLLVFVREFREDVDLVLLLLVAVGERYRAVIHAACAVPVTRRSRKKGRAYRLRRNRRRPYPLQRLRRIRRSSSHLSIYFSVAQGHRKKTGFNIFCLLARLSAVLPALSGVVGHSNGQRRAHVSS